MKETVLSFIILLLLCSCKNEKVQSEKDYKIEIDSINFKKNIEWYTHKRNSIYIYLTITNSSSKDIKFFKDKMNFRLSHKNHFEGLKLVNSIKNIKSKESRAIILELDSIIYSNTLLNLRNNYKDLIDDTFLIEYNNLLSLNEMLVVKPSIVAKNFYLDEKKIDPNDSINMNLGTHPNRKNNND